MDISVVIPTYQRPQKLRACMVALASQSLASDRFEVLVGLDGPDPESEAAARSAWTSRAPLRVITCPRLGYNAARNHILREARGRWLVSMNDDVIAEPRLLETHAREQRAAEERSRPAIIAGYSPFKRPTDETLFDRLARETSMLFFYDRMLVRGAGDLLERLVLREPSPDHDWGFRHCWGMNFSAPMAAVREVGMFTAVPLAYGYDDIELAFRLQKRYAMPVLFRPQARAEHDHRYKPREVLDREYDLGRSAWHFAAVNPEFARDTFNRDIRAEAEIAYSREFVRREEPAARTLEASFLRLDQIPASDIAGPHADTLITMLYQQHLLLKRWQWRRGLLDAAS
jgi:GT2 family glycosyltransferase